MSKKKSLFANLYHLKHLQSFKKKKKTYLQAVFGLLSTSCFLI